METEKCPKCGTAVKPFVNRQAKTRVGSCPKCRKLVTLGKATEKEIAAPAGAAGAGAGSRSGKEKKGQEKSGLPRQSKGRCLRPSSPSSKARIRSAWRRRSARATLRRRSEVLRSLSPRLARRSRRNRSALCARASTRSASKITRPIRPRPVLYRAMAPPSPICFRKSLSIPATCRMFCARAFIGSLSDSIPHIGS